MKSKIKLLYGDIIVISVIFLFSVCLFIVPFFSGSALRAEIYEGGSLKESISLSQLKESYTVNINGCELLIEKDGVSFLSSACPDKLCVNCGKLKRSGDTMACIPQKVTVTLKSDRGFSPDGVTY